MGEGKSRFTVRTWVVLGLLLIGGEMLAPGIFLIWLGLAALLTGAVVGFTGIGWQSAALAFALLCIARDPWIASLRSQ